MRIVITGTSSGIGHELARRLVARGHEVWGFARQAQDEIPGSTGSFRSGKCDVGEWTDIERAAASVTAAWPHVDALVTCAGIQGEVGRTLAADPTRWNSTVRVNLEGTFNALRGFADLLAKAPRRAKIVCFSGGGATKPRPNFSAYGVAKTGVVRLVETIAEEEKGRPLDINAIAPGAINTRLTDEVIALGPDKAGRAEYESAVKQKQTGGASLARALDLVEWLLSPASDNISGRLLSAPWDPWPTLDHHATALAASEIYTLRRITPRERGQDWDEPSRKG